MSTDHDSTLYTIILFNPVDMLIIFNQSSSKLPHHYKVDNGLSSPPLYIIIFCACCSYLQISGYGSEHNTHAPLETKYNQHNIIISYLTAPN